MAQSHDTQPGDPDRKVAYAMLATQWYRPDVVLMRRDRGLGRGLSAQLVQLGSPAELAVLSFAQSAKAAAPGSPTADCRRTAIA